MGKLDGRCLCGAVTYSSDAEPAFTAVCHCKDCQRQSGTSFSIMVGVPADQLSVEGDLATHVTVGEDSEQEVQRQFCPVCGSPVLSISAGMPGVAVLKAGTLDDTSWLEPQVEVWGKSAQPWVDMPQPELTTQPRFCAASARKRVPRPAASESSCGSSAMPTATS